MGLGGKAVGTETCERADPFPARALEVGSGSFVAPLP